MAYYNGNDDFLIALKGEDGARGDAPSATLRLDIVADEYISSNPQKKGVPQSYAGWDRTDYISCEGYKYLHIKYVTPPSQIGSYNAFYDKNKQFISLFSINKANAFYKVDIPENAKYFILSEDRAVISAVVVKSNFWMLEDEMKLTESIKGTTQKVAFNADGKPYTVTHTDANGNVVRTDTFVFGTDTITETRVLADGTEKKLITNLKTLEVEVK